MIVLPLPPSDNSCYGHHGKFRFMFKIAKDWKENAHKTAKKQYKGKITTEDVVIRKIIFYLKHWRDIQGSLKLLFDVMEGVVYENDRQVKQFGPVIKRSDKENPRVEIDI